MSTPELSKVHYDTDRQVLQLTYADQLVYELSAEFLRVMSPSAEVQGHGHPVLQAGKKEVRIWQMEPVGHYALKLYFDDGHDTGLYSWDYLWYLCQNQHTLWQEYLDKLAAAGASRQPKLIPLAVDASRKS